jgi:hypothetical protein
MNPKRSEGNEPAVTNTADVWLTRIVGALLGFVGLAGLVMIIADRSGPGSSYPIFDVVLPVLFILVGGWLFRLAAQHRMISWSYGLGMLLIFLGLAALTLTLDEHLIGHSTAGLFGFLLSLVFLGGGILLIRRASSAQSTSA